MRSQLAERLGTQVPQIVHLPPDVHSLVAAEDAIELANAYGVCSGFPLSESQEFTLRAALGERKNGTWAASTVADFKPRQGGGKTDTIAARELAGLVLFGEKLIIHTAHEFATANESFLRLVSIFENWDDLRRRVARIRWANGEQGIEFLSGQRLKYRARTGGSGRGFAKADLVVYDEAQSLQAEHVAASGPTRLANKNSQAWYAGSGGFATSLQAWRLRRRALAGNAGRLAYVENTAEDVTLDGELVVSVFPDVQDRDGWARANPGLGYWVTEEAMADLLAEVGSDLFGRECLCLWEPCIESGGGVFPVGVWQAVVANAVMPAGQLVFGVDVNPERTRAAIVAVDRQQRVELMDYRAGTGWVAARVAQLQGSESATVGVDASGPAKSLIPELEDAGVVVEKVTDMPAACGAFYDAVLNMRVEVRRHLDLDAAVAGARRKVSGDVWRWDRRDASVDISPLCAATVGSWLAGLMDGPYDPVENIW